MPVSQSLIDAIANLTAARTNLRKGLNDLLAASASDANVKFVIQQSELIGNQLIVLNRFVTNLDPPPPPPDQPAEPIRPGPQVFHAPAPTPTEPPTPTTTP